MAPDRRADIKPANLLLTSNWNVKISDFGVAELLDRFDPLDRCQRWTGTPAYQSPELLSGAETYSGSKSDVWAAGVTLFQLATGR